MSAYDLTRLRAAPFLKHVEFLEETDSTNDVALKLCAAKQIPAPALVLAEKQTAGRGRGANRWWSSQGGLTFSVILQPEALGLPMATWPQISLATALSVSSALEEHLASVRTQVKWPNDVFCQGKKICGILVESPANQPPPRHLVVGIGLNVNNSWANSPAELDQVGTALCDVTGRFHDATDVLLDVVSALEQHLSQLAAGDPRLWELWRERCLLTGRVVTIEAGDRTVTGRCAGLAPTGAILLETPGGLQSLAGGIVRNYA